MNSESTPAADSEIHVEKKPTEPSTVAQGEGEVTATDQTQISTNSVEVKQENAQQKVEEVNHATDQQPDSTTGQTLQTAEMHQAPVSVAEVKSTEPQTVEVTEHNKEEAPETVAGEQQPESVTEDASPMAEVTNKAEVAGEEKGELHQAVLSEPLVMEPAVQVVKLGGSSEGEDEQRAEAHEEKPQAEVAAAVEEGAEKPKETIEAPEAKAEGGVITVDEAGVVKTVVPSEVTIEEAKKPETAVVSTEQQAEKGPKVQGTQTPRTEVTSTDQLEESAKKRNVFGFHIGRSRSKPRQRSLDREKSRSFGANVKGVFGTLKRSIGIEKKPAARQQLTVEAKAPEIVVNVPPHTIEVQTPALDEAQDQRSLHSISGTSISNPSGSIKLNAQGEMPAVEAKTSGLREPPRPHTDYGAAVSLDRRYYGNFDTDTRAIVRRAQTLRTTDYASRLRERIRTFRPQTVEATSADGSVNVNATDGGTEGEFPVVTVRASAPGDTLKRQTLRPKQEVYVCSESFRIPHKLLKFKRRKTSPPKTVRSSGQEAAENARPKYESSYDYDQDYGLEAQVEPAVFAKTEAYQQRVPPPVPRAPVQRPQISTNISVSGQPARQLTSLRSAASPTLLQQSTAIPDSASRGMLQMVSVGGDSGAMESREVVLPYLSGELSDISKVDLLTGITVDEKVFEATCSDKGPILRDALSKVHPFMKLWMTEESQPAAEQAGIKEDEVSDRKSLMHACLQDYLTACVRLRSVDLQGQYAPFHYPLVTFNERYWKKCAKLSGWGDLTVRSGPEWSTEYLRLPPVDPARQTLVFPNVPVDTLLINWLNCHQTVVPTPAEPSLKGTMDSVAYHPVEIITTLDRLLDAYEQEKANTDLWNSCLRLAILLSYNYCLTKYNINTEKHELDTKPVNILVTLCTSNCLIIFHKRPANPPPAAKAETKQQSQSSPAAEENAQSKEKAESGEPEGQTSETKTGSDKETESGVKAEEKSPREEAEVRAEEGASTTAETKPAESEATETGEKGLLKKLSPESKSIEEAIDHEIEKLYQAACSRFGTTNALSYFFKAIAPPDWMAMVVARVCMKRE